MAGLEDLLSEKELDAIKSMRKKQKEDDERTVKIEDEHGRKVELPYSAARNWLRKFGFDLDDEETAPEPEPEPEPEEDDGKPKPVRFAGRRVS